MSAAAKPPKRQWSLTLLILALLVGLGLYSLASPATPEDKLFEAAKEVPISEISRGYHDNQFSKIVIRENKVFAITESGTALQSYKETFDTVSQLGWVDQDNTTVVEVENREANNILMALLPELFSVFLVFMLLFWLIRGVARSQNNALSFGKSKARVADMKQVKTRFKDVAGSDEAKDDLVEVVDFLKSPKKYIALGAKIPKGVLLIGAPGTGKTLLARAVAGEANVPFFSIAGSEFVEMFVGVGASRVRDLFAKAKRNSPCIIFIDEIDAVGRQRGGAGFGGGHDEREQTLNQILTEMDGFEQGTNIIVIAATNRPDVLDQALLRPGRFDRRIFIDKPDLKARQQILEVHARNKKMGKTKLDNIAKQTVGMTGADLENIMNEAAIFAAKRKKKSIAQIDIVDAVEKVAIGSAKKSRKLSQHEMEVTAYHELGHAIVGYLCKESDPLHKISIVSRGGALGVTWFLPQEDQFTVRKQKFLDEICGLLGGRAAEDIVFGEITTGASNDIERASKIARDMAMKYGMGTADLGPVAYGEKQGTANLGVSLDTHRNYSEETARQIDDFVQATLQAEYKRAFTLIKRHKKILDVLAKDLLKKENISSEQFAKVFDPDGKLIGSE